MKTLEQQLAEAQSLLDSIKLQIENKQKFPSDGTICEVWDNDDNEDTVLAYSNGDNTFSYRKRCNITFKFDNFKPLEMGLTFSDKIIHSEDIAPEIHRQLALCWGEGEVAEKTIKVLDSNNKGTFLASGTPNGYTFDNYQLCTTPIGNLPKWARDMINACKD